MSLLLPPDDCVIDDWTDAEPLTVDSACSVSGDDVVEVTEDSPGTTFVSVLTALSLAVPLAVIVRSATTLAAKNAIAAVETVMATNLGLKAFLDRALTWTIALPK